MTKVLESDLRRALDAGEIIPYFQPLVELRTGKLFGFEVLARWNHPVIGFIPPDEFIPVAEHNDLISLLTDKIMFQSFDVARNFPPHLFLSINISPLQLRDRSLARQVLRAAERGGFSLRKLVVEITESALIGNLDQARSIADELKALGVRLALDDFGTGYSSLRHLQALPFDEIKVDTSFVRSMTFNRENRKIAAAVIGLGQSLGLQTVAEGIEQMAQADMLFHMGCDVGQGWLYGRPVPAEELPAILAAELLSPSRESVHLVHPDVGSSLEALPAYRLAQLQAIYDGAPVALCFLDRNLRFVSLNKRLTEVDGVSIGAHIGRTVAEIIPTIFPHIEASLRNALNGQGVSDLELTLPDLQAPDRRRTSLISHQPALDEGGEVVGISVSIVDITERKRAEEALRESEEHYRHAAELNPQIPWTADADGDILEVSPRWETLTGITASEALRQGWVKALHPRDLDRTLAVWQHSLLTGSPVDLDYRIGRGDGVWRWMRARATARRGPDGKILRWYGVLEDIDDQKKVEDALRASEEHLRNTVELNPQVSWIADAGGRLSYWSPRWETLTGLSAEETLNDGWSRALHPEDAGRVSLAWEQSLKSRQAFDAEYRLRHQDGAFRWMRSRAFPLLGSDGEVVRWYGTLEVIDDHKRLEIALRRSEARLQAVFAAVPVGMVLAEAPGGRIILHNPQANRILGLTELPGIPVAEGLLDRPLEIYHLDGRRITVEESPLARAILHGETTVLEQVLLKREDGSNALINLSAAPIRGEEGEFVGGVVAIQDVPGAESTQVGVPAARSTAEPVKNR